MAEATDDGDGRRWLTLGEVIGLTGVVFVSLVSVVSLALAQLGHHDGRVAVVLAAGATAIGAGIAWRWGGPRPALRIDVLELGLLAGAMALSAAFYLPGATYAYVDKDPGVYAAHAFAIARHGDVNIPDVVLESGLDPPRYSGRRFPGLPVASDDPGAVTGQFYHLPSALLATGHDLGGRRGVFQATPLLAMVGTALLLLAVRRAAGTVPAVLATGLLSACMLQVWQARSPSSEILAQLVFVGGLLAAVLAIEVRWWPAAAVSGGLASMGFLVRPDGVLYLLLAAVVVGVLVGSGHLDRRGIAFAAGLGALAPYALWNAYAERTDYTAANGVPGLMTVLAAGGGAIALGGVVGAIRRRRAGSAGPAPVAVAGRVQRRLGGLGAVAAAVTLVLFWYREELLGEDFARRAGVRFATHDEDALRWLSWFLTIPGLIAMAVGIAVLLVQRWKPSLMVLVLPGTALLPLYLWDARIASRLLWWGRRYVPAVLPAMVVLIALGLSWALLQRRWPLRVLAAATAVYVIVFAASQSLDLRGHGEMAGSWDLGADVAATGTADGTLYLFTRPTTADVISPNRNLPGALAFIHDRASSILSGPPSMREIEEYQDALPDREVLLVTPTRQLPEPLPASRFDRVTTVDAAISFWEESSTSRPDKARVLGYEVTVWAVLPEG